MSWDTVQLYFIRAQGAAGGVVVVIVATLPLVWADRKSVV